MKILFFIIPFFLIFHASAQQYYPMPTSNSKWTVAGTGTFPYPIRSCSQFKFAGDTIINGVSYAKLYNGGTLLCQSVTQADFDRTANYYGAVREDLNKKVWIVLANSSSERLKYDFALNPGDTFCFNDGSSSALCLPVSLVDSILINGSYRRQIHFNNNGPAEAWIEGIGGIVDTWGFSEWYYVNISGMSVWLDCFQENDIQFYGLCNYPLGINKINIEINPVKLFPNPVNSELCFEFQNDNDTPLEGNIYSVLGEKVMSFSQLSSKSKMDVSELKEGIYFIYISDRSGKLWTEKIIKR